LIITISDEDFELACVLAEQRFAGGWTRKRRYDSDGVDKDLLGVIGEIAVVRALGERIEQIAGDAPDHGTDIYHQGIRFQVKFNGHIDHFGLATGDLIFNEERRVTFKADIAVLVVPEDWTQRHVRIAGACTRDVWRKHRVPANYSYGPCQKLLQRYLSPLEEAIEQWKTEAVPA
jgi:hypothetical protein